MSFGADSVYRSLQSDVSAGCCVRDRAFGGLAGGEPMGQVFIIRGFGKKKDRDGKEFDFDAVESQLIQPALEQCDLWGGTTAMHQDAGNIRDDMFARILQDDLVICDISVNNANVFYELGVRHALRKKHTIMIKCVDSADATPFDINTDRYLGYSSANPGEAVHALVQAIKASLRSTRETDSPIFLLTPDLKESNYRDAVMVPLDFRDEVLRAQRAKSRGWLRLLADDVRRTAFAMAGLRIIAKAQWDLKDLESAKDNYEYLSRQTQAIPKDFLALANICERLSRSKNGKIAVDTKFIQLSEQALDDVLRRDDTSLDDRSEAMALKARNLKSLWQNEFSSLDQINQRREAAWSPKLWDCFEGYWASFKLDMNDYYHALAALQVAHILKDLSAENDWSFLSMDEDFPQRAPKLLEKRIDLLTEVLDLAIDKVIQNPGSDPEEILWAKVSKVDQRFLSTPWTPETLDRTARAIAGYYQNVVPQGKEFLADAIVKQLRQFESLAIRGDLVQKVLQRLQWDDDPGKQAGVVKPRRRVVVFGGHRIDAPGAPPRFPASREPEARAEIAVKLRELKDSTDELIVLASSAPGADLIVHEVCAELRIHSVLCLPARVETVVKEAYGPFDAWRNRLLDLERDKSLSERDRLAEHPDVPPFLLTLADESRRANWLEALDIDPWDRGLRWMLRLGQAWQADKCSLMVYWDGVRTGKLGGTSHMVEVAEQSKMDIIRIPCQLG